MKKFDKRFFLFFLIALTLLGTGITKNAYAEWEKEGDEWRYFGDYGYKIGWQQINGKWYYFTPGTEVMKIGWFYDEQYNKWYYLNFNGDMDDSKTTSIYPLELRNVQNKIKQFVNEETIYNGTNQIDSNIFARFTSSNGISSKQYYYQSSTDNIYEIKNGILTNIATKEVVNIFTEEQAVQVVKDYLSKNYKNIPQNIKVEYDNEDSYIVHCYDDIGGASLASSWYYVNKTSREVKLMS